jgi:putative ABC transport system permease protein
VAIVSHRLWRDRFGADPAIVGQAVNLGGNPTQIIGIMGETFESLLNPAAEIWAPLRYDGSLEQACRTCRHLRVVGRLASGATVASATAELSTTLTGIAAQHPGDYRSDQLGILVQPLRDVIVGPARRAYLILFSAVVAVLLLACVNVANLLLGQAVERRQEFAVRRALGAGRERVVRQVLLESGWLGLGGAAIGAAIAAVGIRWLAPLVATSLPRAGQIDLDWGVLGFAAATGVVAALGFGAAPALVTGAGSEQLRQGIGITRGRRVRRGLVVVQVGLASALLAATLLLGKSMRQLLSVDAGFEAERVFTLDVQVAGPRFATDSSTWRYFAAVREAARSVPGVEQAALVSQLPLGGNFDSYGLHLESRPRANPQDAPSADRYAVTPGYFETMGIRLTAGRTFLDTDRGGSLPVAIVNEAVARLDFKGQSPIGERIRVGGTDGPGRTVVGVVADVRHHGLDQEATRQFYVPTEQWEWSEGQMILVARTSQDPARLGSAIVAAVRALDPDPTLESPQPMTAVIGGSVGARRLVLGLFQGFALLALALSAVGVYGVMSGGVAERRREFGIRSALGEGRSGLVGSVIKEAVVIGAIGTAAGAGLWLAAAPLVGRFLYGVDASDPTSLLLVGSGLVLVAVLAALRPAWRAGSQSPTAVLRSD